jgi:hypothetical protein
MTMRRLPTRRWIVIRTELAIGALVAIAVPVLIIATPSPMGGGTGPASAVVGIVGVVVGLAWMIRILRDDPEAGPSPWRYRSHDDEGEARF